MFINLIIKFVPAILVLTALQVFAQETVIPDQAAPVSSGLKLQPAVISKAATRAMMLGAARAGKRLVAVGDHGIVLLSDDDGKTFRQAKTVPVRVTLSAVSFADDKNGWAVGQWGVILNSADGGETWQVQRSETTVDQPLFSVYFKDKNRGWAVGLWSLVLDTTDGGKTWNKQKLPTPPGGGKADRNLLAIFAGKSGTLFIAAEQGTIVRSGDEGKTWTYIATGYKGSFWAGIGLRNGTLLVGGLRGSLYRSTDDGTSWKELRSGVKSSLTAFAETESRVYGAGLDGVTIESSDNGATFAAKQRDDRASLTSLAVAPSGAVIAFAKTGLLKSLEDSNK